MSLDKLWRYRYRVTKAVEEMKCWFECGVRHPSGLQVGSSTRPEVEFRSTSRRFINVELVNERGKSLGDNSRRSRYLFR